jgi:hypothetical protein
MIGTDGTIGVATIANTAITGNIISSQIAPSITLTTPIISGNLNLDSAGTSGIRLPTANTITFHTAGTEDVRIDANGNVGIGTSSPTERLDVRANATFGSAAGVDASVHIQSGYDVNIKYLTRLSTDYNGVFSVHTGSTASANTPSSAVLTERMRIKDDGFVGIKNTNPSWLLTVSNTGTSPRIAVEQTADVAADMITFRRNNSERGKINISDSATQYQTSSDYRLKRNISPLTDALKTVAKLKPSSFTWVQERGGREDNGFIAHELQEVLPNAVTGEKDAVELVDIKDEKGNVISQETKPVYQGVDTSFLVATLTAAIQEQQAIIADLKARIEALEA